MVIRSMSFVAILSFIIVCVCGTVGAAGPEAAVHPCIFQQALRAAGLEAKLIGQDEDSDYPMSLYIADLKGSSVTIGFPSAGLQRGKPFMLIIDEYPATVQCTAEGQLVVVDGDQNIAATGIFGIVGCILQTVFNMVSNILSAAVHLNILGILESVIDGVLTLISCIFF